MGNREITPRCFIAAQATSAAAAAPLTEKWLRSSELGIAVTGASVIVMPVLGIAKRRLGGRLGSGATAGEGTQNLMCAAQAAAVLLALAVVALWPGAWPVEPVIALGIAGWSVWEGSRSWRGADCC